MDMCPSLFSQPTLRPRPGHGQPHSLGYALEVGQEIVADNRDELLCSVVQEVTLQHVEDAVQGPDLAGQVAAPECTLQQSADWFCHGLVLEHRHKQKQADDDTGEVEEG